MFNQANIKADAQILNEVGVETWLARNQQASSEYQNEVLVKAERLRNRKPRQRNCRPVQSGPVGADSFPFSYERKEQKNLQTGEIVERKPASLETTPAPAAREEAQPEVEVEVEANEVEQVEETEQTMNEAKQAEYRHAIEAREEKLTELEDKLATQQNRLRNWKRRGLDETNPRKYFNLEDKVRLLAQRITHIKEAIDWFKGELDNG